MGIIPETAPSQGTTTPNETSTSIALDDLVVTRGGSTVLTVGHLEIPPGYTALVGPNGSGKSTLLHVIAGLLAPAAGRVDAGHGRIAYVLQSQRGSEHLLVTAREVVSLARARRGVLRRLDANDQRAIDEAMARLDVTDLARRHLADMSGGQRQRVFIAQGLAQESNTILLDEPVAGLDLASAQTIRAAIDDECSRGRTVIVATHDLDEAARADLVVMLNGQVIAQGLPSDVLRTEHLRKAYQGRVLEIGDGLVVDDGVHHDHHH